MGSTNRRVVAVAYDGLCTFEFGVATELFALPRPELDVDWYDFEVVSVDPGTLRSTGGLSVSAPTDLEPLTRAGTVVLPGWRNPDEPPPADLLDALRLAHRRGARLASICSGVFILAATGLLDGLAATTHWRYVDRLRSAHPRVRVEPDVLYVDNGSLLTSAGSAAGIDLGLHLIRRDHGAAVANQVARRLVLPSHRDGGQAQYIDAAIQAEGHPSLGPTMDWALDRLDQPLTVEAMARHASVSPRTFARRFREATGETPHRWLTRSRVDRARELLETTTLSVDEVARRSGLGSPANLRRHFDQHTRTTPTRYRAAFSRPRSAAQP